jgi:hypothetical protein
MLLFNAHYVQVFFFNLTNSAALLAGREPPRVEKVGPYSYTQRIAKVPPSASAPQNHSPLLGQPFIRCIGRVCDFQ